jgi:hypothetical protein
MQNRAEPQSLQPEKQEKIQSGTAFFFRLKAKVTFKETCVDEQLHKTTMRELIFQG